MSDLRQEDKQTSRDEMSCTPVQVYRPLDELEYLFPPPGSEAYILKWRNTDLRQILLWRDGLCWMPDCDGHTLSSIHEGVITKGDVMGWRPKVRRLTINCGLNCLLLCDRCHGTIREPAREEVAAFMADLYGLDNVLAWLESLTFKSRHPARGWMDEHTRNRKTIRRPWAERHRND